MANITREERERRAAMAAVEEVIIETVPEQQVEVIAARPGLSPEIAALVSALSEAQTAQLATVIQEMKKPSAEEQEKIDAAKERTRNNKAQALATLRDGEQRQAAAQASCDHARPDGKTLFRGQVNSDNHVRLFCSKCRYTSKPISASIFGGSATSPIDLYKRSAAELTIPVLERLAAQSTVPIRPSALPSGAEVDFASL